MAAISPIEVERELSSIAHSAELTEAINRRLLQVGESGLTLIPEDELQSESGIFEANSYAVELEKALKLYRALGWRVIHWSSSEDGAPGRFLKFSSECL